MFNFKRVFKFVFALSILFYILMAVCSSSVVNAGTRTEDLSNLVNYPEIYTAVQELKTAHPNWTFTLLYTGQDWNNVIANETTVVHTRSLVHNSLVNGNIADWVCSICGTTPQDNGSWYCASNKTASYYIDPKNWLNETYIFAFETLSFNSNVHTVEGVQAILAGTFMDKSSVTYIDTAGNQQVINKSYAQMIYDAGKTYNVSPYHLAARVRQEQGNGTSSLISGTVDGAVGYYNYFNIGATGNNTAQIILNGLNRAKSEEWTNPELAINGGAKFLVGGYIGNYQDTLYLQKYHVDSSSKYSLYGHQYQQNVSAPYTESLDVYEAYEKLGILDSSFNFIIPIYDNMPGRASEKPGRVISVKTEDVIVNTAGTSLNMRTGPSLNYGVKTTIPKGIRLIRIEKAEEMSSDGRYWDRVAYNNGSNVSIGYVSREYLQDTDTTEVINETKTIGTMCNLRNGPATTNTRVKQILQQETQVTVIDRIPFSVDGHVWCRVKLADGTQGFVSSAFFETGPTIAYKVEDTNVKVTPDTKITDIPNAVLTSGTFGTGGQITIDGNIYTIIMLGDVSGDGKITPADYVRVKNHIMKTTLLDGTYTSGADVNMDSNITPADYVRIKNHIMNVSKIGL